MAPQDERFDLNRTSSGRSGASRHRRAAKLRRETALAKTYTLVIPANAGIQLFPSSRLCAFA